MISLHSWPSLPSSPTEWLVALGILAAIAARAMFSVARDDKRRDGYKRFCEERGFRFDDERPGEEEHHVATCPLFDQGDQRNWGLSVSGMHAGWSFLAFEYEWDSFALYQPNRRGDHTNRIYGVIWTLGPGLPEFVLTPKGTGAKLAVLFGGQDIEVRSAPQLSNVYRLQGCDEAAVRALWTPEVCNALATPSNQHVAAAGKELMWWRQGRLPPAREFDRFLETADRVRALLLRA